MINPYVTALEVAIAIIIAIFAWYAISLFRKKPVTGSESLIDAKGVVHSDELAPDGEVSINGVIWRAHLVDPTGGQLKKGDPIIVRKIEELTLMVEKSP